MKTKKMVCMLLSFTLFAVAVSSIAGCGSSTVGAEKDVLTISYTECGYGDVWLNAAAKAFEASHEGVTVKLDGSASLGENVLTNLKSGQNLSDVYMILDGAWQEWVSKGYIASLDTVYETEVDTKDGKQKIKDYMLDDIRGKYYMQRVAGQGEAKPWVLPWALVQIGICYNEDILKATPRRAQSGNWTEPPATVAELLEYCGDLTARNIVPFVLPGNANWLEFLMRGWWAQQQGVYEPNTAAGVAASEGAYYDFWNFASANVWRQSGIRKAMETFQSIFVDVSSGSWKNTNINSTSYSVKDAERQFINGTNAMILGGSFLYNEMRDYLDLNKDGKDDLTFKMMPLPLTENAQTDSEGNPLRITYYSTDDIMFVPAKATNLDLAKEFLAFLCNEANLNEFTQTSGSIRPFKYNASSAAGEKVNPFTRSVIELYTDPKAVRLFSYPVKAELNEVSPLYRYKRLDMHGGMEQTQFFSDIRKVNAVTLAGTISASAEKEYPKWKNELGL